MKKIFTIILITVLGLSFFNRAQITTSTKSVIYQSICNQPRTYRIGSIDNRYNLASSDFKSFINEASRIWGSEYGENLFEYKTDGDIEINLVYDQRQFLNNQIQDLDLEVKKQQGELDPKIADFNKRTAEFNAKINKLNQDIAFWNEQGGAPAKEYEELISRQKALNQEAESLRVEARTLNQSTSQFNQQVGELNQTVENFNQQLKYKPEQGEYIYDNGVETINIYFDSSKEELIHTLAHELGHALDMDHNQNPESIMFPKTTTITTLSPEDINSLIDVCAKRNIITERLKNIPLIINQIRTNLNK